MARLTLDAQQEEAVERMVNEPTRAALNASLFGTGKTVTSVEVFYRLNGDVKLIICPLFTKSSWRNTILEQHPESVVKMIDSKKDGQAALDDLVNAEPGWYIIGREYFASKKVRDRILPMQEKIDAVLYDECMKWSNYRSAGWRMMKQFRKVGYRMALSATPSRNKFGGMFAITHWLWPKYEGHDSFWAFVAAHCETEEDFFAGIKVLGEKDPGHYVSSLPCYVRIEADYGELDRQVIEFDLSAKERKIYDTFEKNLTVWIGDNPIIANFPIVKRIRLRQMTLGEVSLDPETDKVTFAQGMESTKLNILKDLIESNPDEPMLVLMQSREYAEYVAESLRAEGLRAFEWTGAVSTDKREAIKMLFMAGEIDYIIATVGSIGEGTDGLQERCRIMVWMERADDDALNQQAERRVWRRGQKRQAVSIELIARDTYDNGVLSASIATALRQNASLKERK